MIFSISELSFASWIPRVSSKIPRFGSDSHKPFSSARCRSASASALPFRVTVVKTGASSLGIEDAERVFVAELLAFREGVAAVLAGSAEERRMNCERMNIRNSMIFLMFCAFRGLLFSFQR